MIGSHPGGTALTERLLALWEQESLREGRQETKQRTRQKTEPGIKQGIKQGMQQKIQVLDLGAGDGSSLAYLKQQGYEARGIDREPKNEAVERQDMTKLSFPDRSFELCLAECSLSVCGDGKRALLEAWRVLKPGGVFLVSDVFFRKPEAPSLSMGEPLTFHCWERAFEGAGFCICNMEDETALWREFFLESLWNGNADEACLPFFKKAGRAGCGYFLACLRKNG